MTFTAEDISRASRQAAAFLAHITNRDAQGADAVLAELGQPLSPDVHRFVVSLAYLGADAGVRTYGREFFAETLQLLAVQRAGETS